MRIYFKCKFFLIYLALALPTLVNSGTVQTDPSSWLIDEPSKSNVYKCRDNEGKIQYSDKVCPQGLRNTSRGWVSVEEEEKKKRLERARERAERVKQRASTKSLNVSPVNVNAGLDSEQSYRNLPESTRWYNPNSDPVCRELVQQIRMLENRSDYLTNKQVGREWSAKGKEAMRLGCNW